MIPTAIHVAAAEAVNDRSASRRCDELADRSSERLASSTTSSRSAGPICRMQCRCVWGRSSAATRPRCEPLSSVIEAALRGYLRIASRRYGGRHRTECAAGVRARDHRARSRAERGCRSARPQPLRSASVKDAVVFLSAALRNYAVSLTKIANDIRWLGSGPRCGLGELKVPADRSQDRALCPAK